MSQTTGAGLAEFLSDMPHGVFDTGTRVFMSDFGPYKIPPDIDRMSRRIAGRQHGGRYEYLRKWCAFQWQMGRIEHWALPEK